MDNFNWLLSRILDPALHQYNTIANLSIKKRAEIFLREIESMFGYRVFITDGFANSGHNPGSLHYIGKAIDFVLLKEGTWEEMRLTEKETENITALAKQYDFRFINEYNNPSAMATAGHYHIEYIK